MKKSGLADSPFFVLPKESVTLTPPPKRASAEKQQKEQDRPESGIATKQPHNRDTITPRNHRTTVPRYHDTIHETMIELVRKAVKEFGKEAATHRFTLEEKKAIADIIYSYKSRGLRTSENEITRIAVNYLLSDYRENGENSILDKVLTALNE